MRLEYFDMIDRVTLFDRDAQKLEAQALVPTHSPVFEGHFPNYPIMPGVLLTETMAQASGFLVLGLMQFSHMPFLMSIDKARFRTFVEPATPLHITAELDVLGSGYAATKASISAHGKPICDAHLRFRIMPFPENMDQLMREKAEKMGLSV